MSEPIAQRERAKHFTNLVKASLNSEFNSNIDWEGYTEPGLQFVIKKNNKKYEMRLEYNATADTFVLYDRDTKTQKNEELGIFHPANITNSKDTTVSEIVEKIKSHTA